MPAGAPGMNKRVSVFAKSDEVRRTDARPVRSRRKAPAPWRTPSQPSSGTRLSRRRSWPGGPCGAGGYVPSPMDGQCRRRGGAKKKKCANWPCAPLAGFARVFGCSGHPPAWLSQSWPEKRPGTRDTGPFQYRTFRIIPERRGFSWPRQAGAKITLLAWLLLNHAVRSQAGLSA